MLILYLLIGVLALCGLATTWYFLAKTRRKEESPFLLLQQQIEGIRAEIQNQTHQHLSLLQKSHQGIDTRLDNAGRVFVTLESRLVKMEEATKQVLEVGRDIASLQQILRAPKLRGNFSEELLSDLLAQMMPQDHFMLQHTFRSGDRVDAVIKTAQGLVAIDAKFPLENFERIFQTSDEETKKGARRLFLQDVKKHIDDIAAKYILPAEGTFEFALMYIPAENVYYEIITKGLSESENFSVMHHALKKKVIPVSPNTFYAYLQTILLGLKGMQVEKRVKDVLIELARLKKEVTSFREDFVVLGRHLKNATGSFEKSEKRLIRLEEKMGVFELESRPEEVVPPQIEKPLQ